MPSLDHVRVVRLLVKHVHSFVYVKTPDLNQLPILHSSDELRRYSTFSFFYPGGVYRSWFYACAPNKVSEYFNLRRLLRYLHFIQVTNPFIMIEKCFQRQSSSLYTVDYKQ